MIINQISVFLENKPGRVSEFARLLGANNIDLLALTIGENQDYGLLRVIVDQPERTTEILSANRWPYTVTPVLVITVPDEPGSLVNVLTTIADEGINIAYCYSFRSHTPGTVCVALRLDDNIRAQRLLNAKGIEA